VPCKARSVTKGRYNRGVKRAVLLIVVALGLSLARGEDEKVRDLGVAALESKATTSLQAGDYKRALVYLDELLRRDGKDTRTRMRRAMAREQTGAEKAALEDYDAVVALGDKKALLSSTNLRLKLGDLAAAEKDLLALRDVALDPHERVAQLTLIGTLRLKQGSPKLAVQSLEEACKLGRKSEDSFSRKHLRDAHYNAAYAYYQLGDFDPACEHMESYRAVSERVGAQLDGNDYAMLCLLHYMNGDMDTARGYLAKASPDWRAKAAEAFDDPAFFGVAPVRSDSVAPVKT